MYSYEPLPNTNFIRVADIHPAEFDNEIVISLRLEPFDVVVAPSPVVPHYEALSYTWGSRNNPSFVKIHHSRNACAKLDITQNLDIALRHLRYVDRPRTVWIDAICIDQSNEIEKAPQVAMMGSLYRLAERVVVWLGPEENDSNHAMALMQDIGAQVYVDFDTCVMEPTTDARDPTLANENVQLPLEERDLCSLYHLFCRPWFERLWVRQEIFLANELAIVVCGSCSMLWKVFRRAWSCFYLKPKKLFQFIDELTDRSNSLSEFLYQDVGRQLPHLRESFGHAKCGDLRDRIYALLSLDRTMEEMHIIPDYTTTPGQLFEDVTKKCMSHFENLEILTECELPSGGSTQNSSERSWVPDWSVGVPYILHLSAGVSYTSGPFVGQQFPIVDGRLRVVAVPVDAIQSLRDNPIQRKPKSFDSGYAQIGIKKLLSEKNLSAEYPGGEGIDMLDAYTRTFTLDQFAETYFPPTDSFPLTEESIQLMRQLVAAGEDELPLEDKHRYFDRAEDALSGRLILETAKQYIGLAPSSALPGDEIFVVLGCSLPLILRRMGGGEQWKLIGACYVCGFNEGEAILGPMPSDIRFVQVWEEESGSYLRSFVNDTTGEVSDIDPRLDAWPTEGFPRVNYGVLGSKDRMVVSEENLTDQGIQAKHLDIV